MAPRFARFEEGSTIIRVDRDDRPGIDLASVEYLVTFGGAKDGVGAVIIAKPKGFDALVTLLRKLPIPAPEIAAAVRILTFQPSHQIADVVLTKPLLRTLGL